MQTPSARATCLVFLLFSALPVARAAPIHLVDEPPLQITPVAPGVVLVDFGRVAFGNLQLTPPKNAGSQPIKVHFGEAFAGGRINRKPPGTVRYAKAEAVLDGTQPMVVAPAADKRNTQLPSAVLTPPEFGVVLPFRWVEIEGWPGELRPENIKRRASFASDWDDHAAAFDSSDETLNRIWELCRYSIKATTFAGIYVDGDRERIAYEGDAYLNQLSHYYVEGDAQMARDSYDRLMEFPTWPTEWATHLIFMAHADWMQTGDTRWLAPRYAALQKKLRLDNARADGLIVTSEKNLKNDLVDWPVGERDGFVFKPVNTVMNAFHLRALRCMADLARALGHDADAADYTTREAAARAAFNQVLLDPASGLYRDGEGTDHASLHANLFPLAFDLVPPENRVKVTSWLGDRGMACSVYAAQYLLEGLFEKGVADKALELMTASGDRSWKHMLDSGTTLTWEAWDQRYKPNQDWNHAWGAAPANLLPRFVLGVQPLTPGWARASIRPHPGKLQNAQGKIPTPRGPVLVSWKNADTFKLSLTLPAGLSARVQIPAANRSQGVLLGGKPVAAHRDGSWWILEQDVTGTVALEAK
ncbi:family 78 glycoside hydrolase catalytic domain [bacterium]|nr:family 78 glycoside hydrolase catalytic domain [bacterium]